MVRKVPVLTLAILMLISTMVATIGWSTGMVFADTSGDFEYELIDTWTKVRITGYVGAGGALVIPGIIEGRPVAEIGEKAFFGVTSLTSVTIPDGVTGIGYQAFYGDTSLLSITMPDSVISIGYYAFGECTALTSITIPGSVVSIWSNAFSRCTALAAINVDENNAHYTSVHGVLYDHAGTTLIQYPAGKAGTSFTIPDSVASIGASAFFYCTALTSITIPASVASIGANAFADCPALATMIFDGNAPSSVGGTWASGHNARLTVFYFGDAAGFTPAFYGVTTSPLGPAATAPNGLKVTSGDGSAILTWSPPSYTGTSAIDVYVVYKDGYRFGTVTSTSAIVTGLTNGQSYEFSVTAHNAAGSGQDSNIISAIPLGVAIISPLEGAYNTTGTVAVQWAIQASSSVVKTEISTDGATWTAVSGTSYTFEDLSDGHYTVQVRVTSTAGNTETASRAFTVGTVGTVSGLVKDNGGGPVAGATVTLKGAGSALTATTNVNGEYAIYGVPVGKYDHIIEKSGYVTVASEVSVTSETVPTGNVVNGTLSKQESNDNSLLMMLGALAIAIVVLLVATLLLRRRSPPRTPADEHDDREAGEEKAPEEGK